MPQNRFCFLLGKKLAGEASDEQIQELEQLMSRHPEWLFAAQHLFDIWKVQPMEDKDASIKAFEQHLLHIQEKGIDITPWQQEEEISAKPFFRRRAVRVIAACLIGVCSFFFLQPLFQKESLTAPKNLSEISTRLGSKSKLLLPDGSTVWLNAGSKLVYNKGFGTDNRNVTLEGEAFFDVVKMPDLPFLIETKSIRIKVLGTAFNVKSYSDEPTTETSLVRGKVEIWLNQRPEEKFILNPNEKLTIANVVTGRENEEIQREKIPLVLKDHLTYKSKDSTAVELAWTENKLVFNDESFAQVAKKMERWYDVKIDFMDEQLREERITGSFTNETITQALEALHITTPFQFNIEQNKISIKK
jgi:ferric-dicitrate binding protein FerR (iron transport regulator)